MRKAVVLAGGGARGSYQIGAWESMIENGFSPDVVCGTSIGSVNGALMTQGDIETAKETWQRINLKDAFDVNLSDEEISGKSGAKNVNLYYIKNMLNGGVDFSPLKEILSSCIDEEKVRNSKIDFGLTTVKLRPLENIEIFKKDIPKGKLLDYILASSACFPALKWYTIDGVEYIDGGYYDNVPVNMAIKWGAREIITVDIGETSAKRVLPKNIKYSVIRPYYDLGDILYFTRAGVERNIRLGYLDAQKHFKKLEGCAFAYENGTEKTLKEKYEKVFLDAYSKIFSSNKNTLLDFHANETVKKHRGISPLLASAEFVGEIFEVDCLRVYSKEEFDNEIKKKYFETEDMPIGLKDIKESLGKIKFDEPYLLKAVTKSIKNEDNLTLLRILALTLPEIVMGAIYLNSVINN